MYRNLLFIFTFVLLSLALTNAANAELVGWWKLDEGSGTIAVDSSRNGNDGTIEGGPQWVAGQFGSGLEFDGTDDYIDLPISPLLSSLTNSTFTIWANFSGTGGAWQRIFDFGTGPTFNMFLTPNNGATGTLRFAITQTSYNDEDQTTAPNAFPSGWHHVAVVMDAVNNTHVLYIDGNVAAQNTSARYFPTDLGTTTQDWLARSEYAADPYFNGSLDDFRIYDEVLTQEGIQAVMSGALPSESSNPSPANGATDVPRDVVLSWTPGEDALTNDVYFGTVFDDVNEASRTNPLDVLANQGQDANTYDPDGLLELEQTYYWRVDAVDSDGTTIHTGEVWSFTTELFTYPIPGENISATASSSEEGKGPENTVNGSGLDESGLLHSNISVDSMWLSGRDGVQPSWIEFEFDKVYKLQKMWVWNSNDSLESMIGLGLKEVIIEYSVDGIDYATLGTTYEFVQAFGAPDYAHDTTVDFNGMAAKYVRLTANSNWGGMLNQYGLSEVRFFYVPVNASEPTPASGATDVPLDVILSWRAGREAIEHNVYFSDSLQAVIDGTAKVATVTEPSYGPLSLVLGKTYYWKVDENDGTSVWASNVWDFRTQEYLVVDDFEDYDAGENQIWYAWKDGLGYGIEGTDPYYPGNGSGSAVGDENTPSYTEETIVHGGSQAMPLFYDNAAGYSEATLTLSSQRNWTEKDIKTLTLWFRGNSAGFVEDPAGTYTISASGVDIWGTADEFRYIYKQLSGPGTITAKVESVEVTDAWAKAGVMIRQSLEPGSKFAAVYITPGNGCRYQARLLTSTDATSDTSVSTAEQRAIIAPYWVKIERDASENCYGYYSSDGVNWVAMSWNPQNLAMPSDVYIGLVVTSHNANATCTGVFSNVETTGAVSPQVWTQQAIGVEMPVNDSAGMYVVLNDSAVVYHEDPDAAQIDEWTEWNIDLEAFADQGIDLANVDTLGIGFGDRQTLQPGGSGSVIFDDIRLYPSVEPRPEPVGPGTENLVHSYTFEDGTADDGVGSADGTLVGDAKVVDGWLILDGDGDWMEMPGEVIAMNTFSEVSIEVRFRAAAGGNTGFHMLAAFGEEGTGANPGAGYRYIFISPARGDDVSRAAIQTRSMDDSPWDEETGVSASVEHDDGLVHHFVCTVNATDITFYIDGEPVGSAALAAGNEIAGIGQDAAYLGKGVYTADPLWTGSVDELNIYNKALSEDEVRYLAGDR
jgi:hypothetical protein